jgi:hypothetical protein
VVLSQDKEATAANEGKGVTITTTSDIITPSPTIQIISRRGNDRLQEWSNRLYERDELVAHFFFLQSWELWKTSSYTNSHNRSDKGNMN